MTDQEYFKEERMSRLKRKDRQDKRARSKKAKMTDDSKSSDSARTSNPEVLYVTPLKTLSPLHSVPTMEEIDNTYRRVAEAILRRKRSENQESSSSSVQSGINHPDSASEEIKKIKRKLPRPDRWKRDIKDMTMEELERLAESTTDDERSSDDMIHPNCSSESEEFNDGDEETMGQEFRRMSSEKTKGQSSQSCLDDI